MSVVSRLFSLITLAGICFAQDFRATITGQVTDSTQAAIAGAEVRAIQDGTNQVTRTNTNSDGIYALQYLMPGKYDLEVSAPGFASLKKRGVTLLVADRIDMPLALEIGKISDTITVTAEQETVQTGNASGGQSFDSLVTSEYPLNGRQVYMLMALSSGVLFTQEQFGSSGFSGTRGWDTNGEYVMNGGVKGTNQFLLNGAPVSLTGSWQLSPNVEAIQEFKVMTNTYDSQFGRTGGGTVNTTLKSGTNGVHGSLFEYLRNSVLDANNTQNNTDGYPRGKHITHQFGGTLGGAVRRDKDFVFGSFEGFRERVPFPVVTDTPPLDLRDGQHFSNYQIKVFDPLTNRLCRAGIDTPKGTNCFSTYIRDAFPNNAIPQSRISPIGRRILDLWPSPTRPALTQNFLAAANTGKYRYDQPMVRWDHIFSEKDRL
ncbi:MAG: carboxypeptidase-like regulatory domain-containing protein, partial [Acidobacteriota bacterium]|nr:carboxypeptidase-like regulatory domain-containing protein [Acidobacteriota bacterium]